MKGCSSAIIMPQPPSPSPPSENVPMGASVIVLAFLLVAVMGALAKGTAVATTTIVFFQCFISFLLFLPWVLRHGISEIKTAHLALHGLRGVAGVLSQTLMFLAIVRMPLMNAVLLSNSAPLFIPIVAWIWLREKITPGIAVSLGIGFVGILLILKPGASLLGDPSALLATASAICSALSLVTANRISMTEPMDRSLFTTTINGGPNTHGHFGWIGHWNAKFLHQQRWERLWQFQQSPAMTSVAC